ncbi:MAG: hypothetical protein OXU61_09535, partial [Gammaproteobacteria bacterium]|nr:hypothetical protein [Gammaproteobacteria bacterium]
SRRWGEHRKRLLHPTAQENRKGRLPPTAAAGAWRLGCRTPPPGGSDGKNEAQACPWLEQGREWRGKGREWRGGNLFPS